MPKPRILAVAVAMAGHGFIEASRDRLAAVLSFFAMLAALLSFFFLDRFVGSTATGVSRYGGYFGFVVVGLVGADLFGISIASAARRIRTAQLTGTLDGLLATPTPEAWIVCLLPIWDICGALFRGTVYLLVASLVFQVSLRINAISLTMAVACALLCFIPLGVLSAALTMLLRRADPLSYFITMFSSVFGPVMYPADALPPWAHSLSQLLPLTHALQALRAALLEGASPVALLRSLVALSVLAAILGTVSLGVFRLALRRVRTDGSLTRY